METTSRCKILRIIKNNIFISITYNKIANRQVYQSRRMNRNVLGNEGAIRTGRNAVSEQAAVPIQH